MRSDKDIQDMIATAITKILVEEMCPKCPKRNTGCTPSQIIECARYILNKMKAGFKPCA